MSVAVISPSVISLQIQQEKLIQFKAFGISLILHLLLLVLIIYTIDEHFSFEKKQSKKVQTSTVISLASYTITPEALPQKTKVVQQHKKVEPKKAVKHETKKIKEVKKVIKEPNIVKPIQEKTLQETQQKQAVVEPLEAFTPQIPHTEQKDKPLINKKELASQNSPLSEQKLSQLALIRSLIQSALRYPTIAKKLRLEGVVVVSFSLSTSGKVSNLQLVQSSSSSVLDKRALQTVSSLDGEFPQLDKKVDLKIPIAFSLQQQS
ncbi:TonB family protein [Sulfurimonas sp.]|uniref:TonB family protein n=1 Tax=Sulfurimonas sp. TaxID=2022749 RepID=UPI003D10C026